MVIPKDEERMADALERIADTLSGTEEYIHFYPSGDKEMTDLANWFAGNGFRWMYQQNGRVTMRRVRREGQQPEPLCEDCSVPLNVEPHNHSRKCPTRPKAKAGPPPRPVSRPAGTKV
jgi:hypothetical protein